MSGFWRRSSFPLAAAAAAALMMGCSQKRPPPREKATVTQVVVSIGPLADLVRRVGGKRVHVTCLLPNAQSLHDTLPRACPEEISRADLVVMIGGGVDEWARPAESCSAPEVLELTQDDAFVKYFALRDRSAASAPASAAATEGAHRKLILKNPCVWLDPVFMRVFAAAVAGALINIDPEGTGTYSANGETFMKELDDLDAYGRHALAAAANVCVLADHADFGYLADRYGFTQVTVDEITGSPGAASADDKIRTALAEKGIKAVFLTSANSRHLEALAAASGVQCRRLYTLSDPQGGDDYIVMMQENIRTIHDAIEAHRGAATAPLAPRRYGT